MIAFFRIVLLIFASLIFTCQGITIVEKKHNEIAENIEKLANFFQKNTIAKTCHAVTWKTEWYKGGEYLFILDEEGTCLAFSNQTETIWKSFKDFNDINGEPILDILFKKEKKQDILLNINNATMRVFYEIVIKHGKKYALCCGFYPQELEYLTLDLSNRTIELFKRESLDQALNKINDPYGEFRVGDISIFIADEKGFIIAQPDNYAFIGKNLFDPKLHSPKEIDDFKKIFNSSEGTGWLVNEFRNAVNKIWCVRYTDKKTQKKYLICTFYYPDISADDIYSLVQRAIATIQTEGLKKALNIFNYATKRSDYPFAKGTASISVYSLDGTCLAYGEDPSFVGENVLNRKDKLGKYPMKGLLENINQSKRAWFSEYSLGAYKLMYAEKVDVAEGSVVVVSGYWLHSKFQQAKDMVERGVDLMKRTTYESALNEFMQTDSDFLRGDVYISMFDIDKYTIVDGPFKKTSIWKKMPSRDAFGRSILEQIMSLAATGGGWITYKHDNAQYHAFVKQVESQNRAGVSRSSILLSGYYI